MPIPVILLGLIAAISHPPTQLPRVERLDIHDYGIYAAAEQSCHRNDQGILLCDRTDVRHTETTLTVPARLGVHFGFRYKIVGAPDEATVRITGVIRFPSPGLQQPDAAAPIMKYEYQDNEQIGQIGYIDYAFDDPWELVPGSWSVEVWIDGERMAAQTFTVVRPQ
jgi:hypothetical protein